MNRADTRAWAGLAVLALPTLLIGLDLTVLHLAAPQIAADLRPGPVANLWIIDVYGFAVAGLLLTMGSVGDRIGRRRLLMAGAVGFALASVLAAFASSAGMLIAARALLGIAGATLMPSTLSLIRDLFADDRQRTVAISIWMASLLTGSAIGPLVGGTPGGLLVGLGVLALGAGDDRPAHRRTDPAARRQAGRLPADRPRQRPALIPRDVPARLRDQGSSRPRPRATSRRAHGGQRDLRPRLRAPSAAPRQPDA